MAESYIVRIYRRDPTDPNKVVGRVIAQADAQHEGQTFTCNEELLRLLSLSSRDEACLSTPLTDQ